jgi:hypothetical protein
MMLVEVMSDGLSTGMMTSDEDDTMAFDPDGDAMLAHPERTQKITMPDRQATDRIVAIGFFC